MNPEVLRRIIKNNLLDGYPPEEVFNLHKDKNVFSESELCGIIKRSKEEKPIHIAKFHGYKKTPLQRINNVKTKNLYAKFTMYLDRDIFDKIKASTDNVPGFCREIINKHYRSSIEELIALKQRRSTAK